MNDAELHEWSSVPRRIPWWWYPSAIAEDSVIRRQRFSEDETGQHWTRAINVDAAPDHVFEWVTQLRRAPYSYDWADNFGRQSPQTLDRRLIEVSIGDSVMTIFTVIRVVPSQSMTILMNEGTPTSLFGRVLVCYSVESRGSGSRLQVEMFVPQLPGLLKTMRRYALAWGDLIMMRKQLKELKRLSEKGADR